MIAHNGDPSPRSVWQRWPQKLRIGRTGRSAAHHGTPDTPGNAMRRLVPKDQVDPATDDPTAVPIFEADETMSEIQSGPDVLAPNAGPERPLLKLRNVDLGYTTGQLVIDSLDLDVNPGEIVSIVGPSGCGKSSLLRLIANLRAPNAGKIDAHYHDTSRHGCSMVFQEDTLLPWLRLRDNVLLYHRFRGTRRSAEAARDATRLLQMVGLEGSARLYPSQLSGGMRRRVAVLTALCAMPQLLLLDEPFSALDEPTRVEIHCDLYALVHTLRSTVVLVTHDLAEAISLSDRVVLMSRAPSRVIEDHQMPFGTDRDIRNIRTDNRFLEIYATLWESMERQAAKGRQAV